SEQLLANEVFFDRLTFENFNLAAVELVVEMAYDADFVDVFQVRGVARERQGQYYRPVTRENQLSFYYRGRDGLLRYTVVDVSPKPAPIHAHVAGWDLNLP